MALTDEELAVCARDCMLHASTRLEPAKLEEDARLVLQRLVDDRNVRVKHRDAVRALRRALDVDMSNPSNRKGALPRAIGLVSRMTKDKAIKQSAVVTMMHRMLEHSAQNPVTKEMSFPYALIGDAAEAVTRGFFEAGIDIALSAENVEQIWTRRFQAAKGPQDIDGSD